MRCVSESDLQAFADGEAAERVSSHVTACARCRDRVDQMRRDAKHVASFVNSVGDMPLHASARVRRAIAADVPRRGGTTLRRVPRASWRRPALVSAMATVAIVALVVFGLLPRFGAPTTLSASEVLTRSLQTLSSTQGIELLDYELVVDGVLNGAWRIEQLIDHATPTHYRMAVYTKDGVLLSALSQDPSRGTRSQLVRVDDRNYIVDIDAVSHPVLSIPQVGQALIETAIAMMQASSDQNFSIQAKQYVIEMPPVTTRATTATLELHRARAVVNGEDFRIEELEAAGAVLRQPFSVSFKLLRRDVWGAEGVPDSAFEIQRGPEDVVLHGVESHEPMNELLNTLVRALARDKAF